MSTVAFDGRFFVADTQVTGGGMVHGFSKMKVLRQYVLKRNSVLYIARKATSKERY